jgi:hypothetical protein
MTTTPDFSRKGDATLKKRVLQRLADSREFVPIHLLAGNIGVGTSDLHPVMQALRSAGLVDETPDGFVLTEQGRQRAAGQGLVASSPVDGAFNRLTAATIVDGTVENQDEGRDPFMEERVLEALAASRQPLSIEALAYSLGEQTDPVEAALRALVESGEAAPVSDGYAYEATDKGRQNSEAVTAATYAAERDASVVAAHGLAAALVATMVDSMDSEMQAGVAADIAAIDSEMQKMLDEEDAALMAVDEADVVFAEALEMDAADGLVASYFRGSFRKVTTDEAALSQAMAKSRDAMNKWLQTKAPADAKTALTAAARVRALLAAAK